MRVSAPEAEGVHTRPAQASGRPRPSDSPSRRTHARLLKVDSQRRCDKSGGTGNDAALDCQNRLDQAGQAGRALRVAHVALDGPDNQRLATSPSKKTGAAARTFGEIWKIARFPPVRLFCIVRPDLKRTFVSVVNCSSVKGKFMNLSVAVSEVM